MFQDDLDRISGQFKVINRLFRELGEIKDKITYELKRSRFLKTNQELLTEVKGWVKIANRETGETAGRQRAELEGIKNVLEGYKESLSRSEETASQIAIYLKSLGDMSKSIKFLIQNLGGRIFLEDEQMQERLEKLENEFLKYYGQLEELRKYLTPLEMSAFESFEKDYGEISGRIEKRKEIRPLLGQVLSGIVAIRSKLHTMPPNFQAIMHLQESDPAQYQKVINFENKEIPPILDKIYSLLYKFKGLMARSMVTMIEEAQAQFTNYIFQITKGLSAKV